MSNKPCDHIIKQQENGEYRCFMCWQRFIPATECDKCGVEWVIDQGEAEGIDAARGED